MAGSVTEESGVGRSLEGASFGQQQCQYGEALAEWRSSEQVENGITSTSPPYWDSDGDDDGGLKPSELYGKYTWKIDKFSQINKRELRSNAFEVGGYKWYILIYPQGCDVCNHLSLFLCVANHDKLLPGWKHFAQFTIAVVNKDPKKSKYSDTLHRFWKKEHDWGWKKFMELSKVLDGFIDADTLIIKAQVQVIRERTDRPFRCLDCQYRRELVRVYLTNVEQICRRFVEERRCKLGKLIEDKARWSSFRAFWLGMDQSARRQMSREKTDDILKVVVKHFFIEKEVTSTLVMDSLYSGLKSLEDQTKLKKSKGKYLDVEDLSVPIVRMEKDMFVLVDDVLMLLERVSVEPLPPKDEKGLQNRSKDGSSAEDFNKDSIERDERRLTELGRRTIEIFVLAHIFSSKIEVAYQEAVALKRQEELIREEEAGWMAGSEHKAKRGASEKEKKSKKKQGKQKRNNRKAKDRRDEKSNLMMLDDAEQESLSNKGKDYLTEESEAITAKGDAPEDASDTSESIDCVPEILQPDSGDRDTSPVNWDTDTLDFHPPNDANSSFVVQNGTVGRSALMDDSSSTCSTDSVPSLVTNGPYKGAHTSQKSPIRGHNQQGKATCGTTSWANGTHGDSSETVSNAGKLNDASGSGKVVQSGSQASTLLSSKSTLLSSKNHMKSHEQHGNEEEDVSKLRKPSAKHEAIGERYSMQKFVPPPRSPSKDMPLVPPPRSPSKGMPLVTQLKLELKNRTAAEPTTARKPSSDNSKQANESTATINSSETMVMPNRTTTTKPLTQQVFRISEKPSTQQVPLTPKSPAIQQVPHTTEKPPTEQLSITSRPSTSPLVPGLGPTPPAVSVTQKPLPLSRSVSATGRLDPDPSLPTHSYIPQSYRNAMMSNPVGGSSTGFSQPHFPCSLVNSSLSYSQMAAPVSAPMFLPQCSERVESNSMRPSLSFGALNYDLLQNGPQWNDCSPRDYSRNMPSDHQSRNFDMYNPLHNRSQDLIHSDFQAGTSGRQTNSTMADEFPHLDIINDLLDDEHGIGKVSIANSRPQHLNCQISFAGEVSMSNDLGPSTSSSRFEHSRSYHDDGRGYVFPGGPFDMSREMIPSPTPRPYANRHIDGLVPPSQWQMVGFDQSFLSMSTENDGHSYHMPDYSNLACSVNGYCVVRPSNGH